jgi:hypothetical protein
VKELGIMTINNTLIGRDLTNYFNTWWTWTDPATCPGLDSGRWTRIIFSERHGH